MTRHLMAALGSSGPTSIRPTAALDYAGAWCARRTSKGRSDEIRPGHGDRRRLGTRRASWSPELQLQTVWGSETMSVTAGAGPPPALSAPAQPLMLGRPVSK